MTNKEVEWDSIGFSRFEKFVEEATARYVVSGILDLLNAGIKWDVEVEHEITRWAENWLSRHKKSASIHLVLSTNKDTGENMASFTINTTDGTADLQAEDAAGDPIALPTGSVVVFASDDTAVLTAGTSVEGATPGLYTAPLTLVAAGSANVSVTVVDASGNPLLETEGANIGQPIPLPAPVNVTVTAGAVAQFVLGVTG